MSRLQFLKKNREKILSLADKRGGYNVRVFGSVARGEENQASDIDFLMTFREGTTLFDTGCVGAYATKARCFRQIRSSAYSG